NQISNTPLKEWEMQLTSKIVELRGENEKFFENSKTKAENYASQKLEQLKVNQNSQDSEANQIHKNMMTPFKNTLDLINSLNYGIPKHLLDLLKIAAEKEEKL
ncbi:MAG: hypothetical protein MHPSP_002162, partial [Paramarteilia canceri]